MGFVSVHSPQLLYAGMFVQHYLIFMVLKDLFIVLSQVFYGGHLGFWHAVVLHIVSLPLDIIVLLGVSIWGSAVLN